MQKAAPAFFTLITQEEPLSSRKKSPKSRKGDKKEKDSIPSPPFPVNQLVRERKRAFLRSHPSLRKNNHLSVLSKAGEQKKASFTCKKTTELDLTISSTFFAATKNRNLYFPVSNSFSRRPPFSLFSEKRNAITSFPFSVRTVYLCKC